MAVDLNATRIDPHDPQIEPMLRNLQGNILKGHGRDLVTIVFTSLRGSPDVVRSQLATIAARVVTSALAQRDQTEAFRATRVSGGLFGNILLSSKGYQKLGFTDDQLKGAFPETQGDFGELSNFFEGMQAHGDELNDPAPSGWEAGYRDGTIDAMFLLADDDKNALQAAETQLRADLAGFADVLAVEHGNALRTAKGQGFENFGFLDGRSQPIYFAPDLAEEGPIDAWDPSEPLARVLVADGNVNAPDCFGSYLVFRKLEQNVLGFKTRVEAVADALGLVGPDRARAGAMAVGRFENGTPLISSPTPVSTPPANNFRNDADPQGLQCPFHAHTRKTNPRGDIVAQFGGTEEQRERAHRITRRGIPYGTRAADMNDRPTKGVGLLFMCFQASISNQFTFMQRSWANKEDFLLGGTGADPVIAQRSAAGGDPPVIQQWPTQWGQAGTAQGVPFGQFVTLKGGEFFFAPSLAFFKNLTTAQGASA